MKMLRNLLKCYPAVLATAMAVSCGHSSISMNRVAARTDRSDTIVVNYSDTAILALQDCIDSVKYVVLESNAECPIGYVDAVYFTDSSIVVVDYRIASSVYLFGYDGKFRGRVSQPGNGPHEYLNLTYVTLSHDSRMIVIQDRQKDKVMWFDMNGKYCRSTDGTANGGDVEYVAENCLIHETDAVGGISRPNDHSSFVATDSTNGYLYSVCQQQYSSKMKAMYGHPLRRQGSRIIGRRVADNSIYEFTETGPEIIHYVKIIPDDFSGYKYEDTDSFFKGQRLHQSLDENFIETDSYSYFSVSQDYQQDYLYSHSDRKLYRLKTRFNRLILGFFFRPITSLNNDWMVSVSEPFVIYGLANQFPNLEQMDEELYGLKQKISLDDNPVIFFYHIKKDIQP